MGPKQCQVCNEAVSKYKCPTCLVPYCSVGCFKKHKVIPCVKPTSSVENSVASGTETPCVKPISSVGKSVASGTKTPGVKPSSKDKSSTGAYSFKQRPIYVDHASEVLKKEQLEAIASSSEILEALKDEDIQKLIYNIDSSPDAEKELDRAMESEAFRIFTDKILSTINSDKKL